MNQTIETSLIAPEEKPISGAANPCEFHDESEMREETQHLRIVTLNGLKQLKDLYENCQSLLQEMREATVRVTGKVDELMESQSQQSFGNKLQQEREKSARKIQAVRVQCQGLVLQMVKTVKEYFKKVMEETCREHRQELEEARRGGIEEGMKRQRDLLWQNMVCTNCNVSGGSLFVCTGCWSACYCGESCQKSHWQTHMELCHWLRPSNDESKKEKEALKT